MKRTAQFGLFFLCILGLVGLGYWVLASFETDARPNIVLIVADDLGPHIGAYDDTTVPTPNLDRLADEGVQFQNAFATQASCSPSRSSIFTGLYPHQNGQMGLTNAGYSMRPEVATMPQLFRRAGYRTGVLGKVHVLPKESLPFDFRRAKHDGFDRYSPLQVAAAAREFIEESDDQRFFLMVNLGDTHRPFQRQVDGLPADPVGVDNINLFPVHGELDSAALRGEVTGYYQGVQRADAGVGLILDVLAEAGRADNTLVLFTSDHGPPFSRGKVTTYEFGLQVPLLVYWPNQIVSGQRRSELVSLIDLLPTVLDTIGEPGAKALPGLSLLPLLQNQTTQWRQYLFAEFNDHSGKKRLAPQRSIRDDRYKLIQNLLPGRPKAGLGVDGDRVRAELADPKWRETTVNAAFEAIRNPPPIELYDLESDPIEYVNLAANPEYKKVERRLLKALRKWRRNTKDPYLNPKNIGQDAKK